MAKLIKKFNDGGLVPEGYQTYDPLVPMYWDPNQEPAPEEEPRDYDWSKGQDRRAWLDDTSQSIADTVNYYLGPTGVPERAGAAMGALEFTDAGDYPYAAEASQNLWNNPSVGTAAEYAAAIAALSLPIYSARMGEGFQDLTQELVDSYDPNRTNIIGGRWGARNLEEDVSTDGWGTDNRWSRAVEDLVNGRDPDEVYLNHGIFTGLDDKLRFEINDSNSFIKLDRNPATNSYPTGDYTLEEVIDHPELFRAYPELRNLPIHIGPRGSLGEYAGVAYGGSNPRIGMTDLKGDEFRSVLLHEIQHAVQDIEGFSGGGAWTNAPNWEDTRRMFTDYRNELDQYGRQVGEVLRQNRDNPSYTFINELERLPDYRQVLENQGAVIIEIPSTDFQLFDTLEAAGFEPDEDWMSVRVTSPQELSSVFRIMKDTIVGDDLSDTRYLDLYRQATNLPANDIVRQSEWAVQQKMQLASRGIERPEITREQQQAIWDQAPEFSWPQDSRTGELVKPIVGETVPDINGLDIRNRDLYERGVYKRLAGEVEARNVQFRRDYSPESRLLSNPEFTEDVPREYQQRRGFSEVGYYSEGGLVTFTKGALEDYKRVERGEMSEEEFKTRHGSTTKEYEDRFLDTFDIDIVGLSPEDIYAEGRVHMKGLVKKGYAQGGMAVDDIQVDPVSGNPVPPGSAPEEVRDDIDAKVSEGEYIVPANVVQYYGVKYFEGLVNKAEEKLTEMTQTGRTGQPAEEMPQSEEMAYNEGGMVPEDAWWARPTQPQGQAPTPPRGPLPGHYDRNYRDPAYMARFRRGGGRDPQQDALLRQDGSALQGLDWNNPDSIVSWASERLQRPESNSGGLLGRLLPGGLFGLAREAHGIAQVNAAARIARQAGNEDLANRLSGLVQQSDSSVFNILPREWYDGDMIASRVDMSRVTSNPGVNTNSMVDSLLGATRTAVDSMGTSRPTTSNTSVDTDTLGGLGPEPKSNKTLRGPAGMPRTPSPASPKRAVTHGPDDGTRGDPEDEYVKSIT